MKTIYAILVFCSCSNVLLAYPVDYNETSIAEADELLGTFRSLVLQPDFPSLLNEFYKQISSTNHDVYREITNAHENHASSLRAIEESAKNVNTDIVECTKDASVHEVDSLYIAYDRDCVLTTADVGKNIVSIGHNKQQILFFEKYNELMHYYRGCITPGDPAPKLCAGVFAGTIQEAKRILPSAKSYAIEIERHLRKEILNLKECANTLISIAIQKLQNEFDKAKECISSRIIIATAPAS